MSDPIAIYNEQIKPLLKKMEAIAVLNDIPFIAVFQYGNTEFDGMLNMPPHAVKEMKQCAKWWIDGADSIEFEEVKPTTDDKPQLIASTTYDEAQDALDINAFQPIEKDITIEDMRKADETIEKIIAYVEGQGFKAVVDPSSKIEIARRLRIWKMSGVNTVHVDVALSVASLATTYDWQYMAHRCMKKIDEAIEKGPPPLTAQELARKILDIADKAYEHESVGGVRRGMSDIVHLCRKELNMIGADSSMPFIDRPWDEEEEK